MKTLLITPKDDIEFNLLTSLCKKLRIDLSELSYEELEEIGKSNLIKGTAKTKKANSAPVVKKPSSK